jgi:hypothetical protein
VATTEAQETNKSVGREIQIPCATCVGKTYHIVLASVDKSGSEDLGRATFEWNAEYQIVQCLGCKTISFRSASSNSEDYDIGEGGQWEYAIREDLYPSRIDGRKGMGENALYLPAKAQRLYTETLQALATNCPVLAGVGLRALVETVCEERDSSGKNLLEKIDDLVAKQILTPAGAQILHRIRTLGNSAAHEVKPHSEKQLALAMDVVEHVLTHVYILPKQVAAEFADD